jgi:hypothetical protein
MRLFEFFCAGTEGNPQAHALDARRSPGAKSERTDSTAIEEGQRKIRPLGRILIVSQDV